MSQSSVDLCFPRVTSVRNLFVTFLTLRCSFVHVRLNLDLSIVGIHIFATIRIVFLGFPSIVKNALKIEIRIYHHVHMHTSREIMHHMNVPCRNAHTSLTGELVHAIKLAQHRSFRSIKTCMFSLEFARLFVLPQAVAVWVCSLSTCTLRCYSYIVVNSTFFV